MSERMSLNDILREFGVPLTTLEVKASAEQCQKLREHLMARTANKEQAYLEVECTFYVDIHDIDRYLSGELPNLAEIYTFPEDVKKYKEE